MGDSDEIRPGDRFERVVDSFLGHVVKWGVYTALAKESVTEGHDGWSIEELSRDHIFYGLSDAAIWRRLPRTDAPAVKVGDVVKDPALLRVGMELQWESGGGERRWATPGGEWCSYPWLAGCLPDDSRERVRTHGVRIFALPEPPRAEAAPPRAIVCGGCFEEAGHKRGCSRAAPPAPARCKPGCTPKEPCRAAACPWWEEISISAKMGAGVIEGGISSELPPARASTYQPRCAELAGWGSWNGRAGK